VSKPLLARAVLVVPILATLGLLIGLIVANALTGREERFTAQATLAMLPEKNIPLEQVSNFWEILSRGQATGSAAIVLNDGSWLDAAAQAAGVPKSQLTVSAGAVPNTTLITVTMTAQSARAAEVALESVLANATPQAAAVSGPFSLETIVPPAGSARAMGPAPVQMLGALGVAGLLAGAGVGLLISRSVRERLARHSHEVAERSHPEIADQTRRRRASQEPAIETVPKLRDATTHNGVTTPAGKPVSVEMPLQ
jgi:hypothetical protein